MLTISTAQCRILKLPVKQLNDIFLTVTHLHNLKITIINISSTLNVYAIHLFFKGSNYIYVDLRKNKSYFAS